MILLLQLQLQLKWWCGWLALPGPGCQLLKAGKGIGQRTSRYTQYMRIIQGVKIHSPVVTKLSSHSHGRTALYIAGGVQQGHR
mmetsp:Transcript_17220/g.28886  ORF Transcript_17220/g.28886 Transcript_17220/m.28886 type:complete len:83 (-) Transcript_17220:1094-1342(-)